jgi:iron complex outermembrane receptor protein
VNAAVSHASENSNIRFSLTRQDNQSISYGGKNERNIANLNSSFKLGKSFTTDVMVNFVNQFTHNRPFMVDRMINNFTGMIGRFDNPDWYAARYKTSLGYRYVTGANTQSLTPEENIIYPGFRADVADYFWNSRANQEDERSDRLIGSLTNTWSIVPDLQLRTRFSTDLTTLRTEGRGPNAVPLLFDPNSGGFSSSIRQNNILYGDALLTYSRKLTQDFTLKAMGGYTVTKEKNSFLAAGTNGGLIVENWFDLAASRLPINGVGNRRENILKEAFLGTLNLDYKEYLFVEGTLRSDKVSTMNPNGNQFLYPSVNSAFVFTEAFTMPTFFTYGKLRASWGIVGNYPGMYEANVAYNTGNLGTQGGTNPILITTISGNYGNDLIEPERKKELELGLETKFFDNRLGLDVSYYNAQIINQILGLTLPATSGATSILANIGTLRNSGLEIGFNGTPVRTTNFNWNSTLNFAFNNNKLESLNDGSKELLHADYDGNAAQLKSFVGQPMGDIYAHPVATNAQGQKIVGSDGLYRLDDNLVKVGNYMPKMVGGFINNFNYKNVSLDLVLDFRFGGHVMPTGINWMISRGLLEESLTNMDAEHGGISYYRDADGRGVAFSGTQGPNGEKVYDDGMLMEGVNQDGSPNTNVISQAAYYLNTYNWGGPQYESVSRYELYVKKNSYIKMREIALSYKIPTSIASKIGAKNLQLSAFGRNLFFAYRTLKDLDPEQMTSGSRWYNNVSNVGGNPTTRTFGLMLRSNF